MSKTPQKCEKDPKTAHSRRRLHSYNLKETITSDKVELIILVNLFFMLMIIPFETFKR